MVDDPIVVLDRGAPSGQSDLLEVPDIAGSLEDRCRPRAQIGKDRITCCQSFSRLGFHRRTRSHRDGLEPF